jgi:general secretion pathway protein F
MPRFHFRASSPDGKITEGRIEAADSQAVHKQLASENLVPMMVSSDEKRPRAEVSSRSRGTTFSINRGASVSELAEMASELAKLVGAGLPIMAVASEMQGLAPRQVYETIWMDIRTNITNGMSLSDSMRKHPRFFPGLFVEMVAAGEESGQLGPVLERMAEYLGSANKLRSELITTLVYPLLMIVVAAGCIVKVTG